MGFYDIPVIGPVAGAITGHTNAPTTQNPNRPVTGAVRYDVATNTLTDVAGNVYQIPPGAKYNPQTGLIMDASGRQYTPDQLPADSQIKNPDMNTLAGQANVRGGGLLNESAGYRQREGQTFGQEQALADTFRNTITNPNAPSVAKTQLVEGSNMAQAAQLSAAAGVAGDNAALARQNAARNMAAIQMQQNNALAEQRARETAQAQAGLAATLNAMAGQSTTLSGQTQQGAEVFSDEAAQLQRAKEAAALQTQQGNATNQSQFLQKGLGNTLTAAGL